MRLLWLAPLLFLSSVASGATDDSRALALIIRCSEFEIPPGTVLRLDYDHTQYFTNAVTHHVGIYMLNRDGEELLRVREHPTTQGRIPLEFLFGNLEDASFSCERPVGTELWYGQLLCASSELRLYPYFILGRNMRGLPLFRAVERRTLKSLTTTGDSTGITYDMGRGYEWSLRISNGAAERLSMGKAGAESEAPHFLWEASNREAARGGCALPRLLRHFRKGKLLHEYRVRLETSGFVVEEDWSAETRQTLQTFNATGTAGPEVVALRVPEISSRAPVDTPDGGPGRDEAFGHEERTLGPLLLVAGCCMIVAAWVLVATRKNRRRPPVIGLVLVAAMLAACGGPDLVVVGAAHRHIDVDDITPVMTTFELRNKGDTDVAITRITKNCACLSTAMSTDILQPNDTATVTLTLMPAAGRTLDVRADLWTTAGSDPITLKATIAAPVDAGWLKKTGAVDFGTVLAGRSNRVKVRLPTRRSVAEGATILPGTMCRWARVVGVSWGRARGHCLLEFEVRGWRSGRWTTRLALVLQEGQVRRTALLPAYLHVRPAIECASSIVRLDENGSGRFSVRAECTTPRCSWVGDGPHPVATIERVESGDECTVSLRNGPANFTGVLLLSSNEQDPLDGHPVIVVSKGIR